LCTASPAGQIHWKIHSQRFCGGLWTGLQRFGPQSAGYLYGFAPLKALSKITKLRDFILFVDRYSFYVVIVACSFCQKASFKTNRGNYLQSFWQLSAHNLLYSY
jgi:hypothetical protein